MFQYFLSEVMSMLNESEVKLWWAAVEKAEETFFAAMPFHCAIGTKP